VSLIVEGAGDEHIEASITGLAGGGDEIGPLNGAELGTNEDGGTPLRLTFQIPAFGADQLAGPRGEGGEGDAVLLVGLLHTGGFEVLQDHLREGLLRAVFGGEHGAADGPLRAQRQVG